MNKVVLLGRLTKDPDLRYTPQGLPVLTFSLAVDRNFKNANGEREADFIQIVVWRKLAETLAKYLKKGARVVIAGRLQTRSYDGNDGQKRYVTEVVADDASIIDWNGPAGGNASGAMPGGMGSDIGDMNAPPAGFTSIDAIDDDVPF